MIRHIVFFTAASSGNLEPILDGLALLTNIPHARRLQVAQNRRSDPASKEVDVVVYGEFDTDAELASALSGGDQAGAAAARTAFCRRY